MKFMIPLLAVFCFSLAGVGCKSSCCGSCSGDGHSHAEKCCGKCKAEKKAE